MKKYLSIAAALIVMVGVVATTGTASTSNEKPCEPQDAWTETTEWVEVSPGADWRQVDEKKVVTTEATSDQTVDSLQHYSWIGGRLDVNNPPADVPPNGNWQANTESEPHGNGQGNPATWVNSSLHYTANSQGHASWFYLEVTTETIPGQAEVSHQEYKFAFDHPAVDCPGEELAETSASVEAVQPTCDNDGEYSLILGNEDEVAYSVEGEMAPGSTVSVTASAKAGFELMGNDEWEITFDSIDPSSCEEDPEDPIPGSGVKPTLTSSGTGSGSSSSSSSSGPQVKAATTSDAPTGSTLPFSL